MVTVQIKQIVVGNVKIFLLLKRTKNHILGTFLTSRELLNVLFAAKLF